MVTMYFCFLSISPHFRLSISNFSAVKLFFHQFTNISIKVYGITFRRGFQITIISITNLKRIETRRGRKSMGNTVYGKSRFDLINHFNTRSLIAWSDVYCSLFILHISYIISYIISWFRYIMYEINLTIPPRTLNPPIWDINVSF